MNIYEKLQKARIELQNKTLKKSGLNKFSNFTYFELMDFIPQTNKIFHDLKLTSVFSILEDKATLTIINSEKVEERIEFVTTLETATIKGASSIQLLGATHTYLKRYLYYNALEIVESDTVDSVNNNINNDDNNDLKKKAIQYIKKHSEKNKNDIHTFLEMYEVDKIENLELQELETLCGIIKQKK